MRVFAVLCLVLFVGGCAAPKMKQPPPPPRLASDFVIAERLPTDFEKHAATSVEKTYFGVSGASGNVVGGLLFGPLGVLANAAYIASENQKRSAALAKLTSQDLRRLLSSNAEGTRVGNSGDKAAFEVVPAANLHFLNSTTYVLGCTISAKALQGDAWHARYAVNVDSIFQSDDAEHTEAAIRTLGPCFREAHALFQAHVTGSLSHFVPKQVKLQSADKQYKREAELMIAVDALPSRVIANDYLGVTRLRASEVVEVK